MVARENATCWEIPCRILNPAYAARPYALSAPCLQAAQRALVVAREKASNEAKSEFMSLMCHEVRTPLNGCLASAEMLLATALEVRPHGVSPELRRSALRLALRAAFLGASRCTTGATHCFEPWLPDNDAANLTRSSVLECAPDFLCWNAAG